MRRSVSWRNLLHTDNVWYTEKRGGGAPTKLGYRGKAPMGGDTVAASRPAASRYGYVIQENRLKEKIIS